ncbi:hypothetical protein B0T11DRAFT_327102 [Plectosphaerella cucumerina]|uniref:Beta-xylosidase n=1 Tax=Plectosphaerella cucumerina TaxID=40658 RepID=A0A8K0TNR3_9PEZI|nr:hypothetical protein B0T11DRAFT_327102 [Plectosphaerella cucumerina]
MSTSRQNHRGRSPPRRNSTNPNPNPKTGDILRKTSQGGIASRRGAKSPAFREKLRQMTLPLAPLVQMTTGAVHPAFPTTLLKFWLLTETQLDDLAHFYHQRTPGPWTSQYPCPITWPAGLKVEEKRRKMGKFIGLRGCTTPTVVCPPPEPVWKTTELPSPARRWLMSEAEIVDDAQQARLQEDADEALRNKIHWYR